MKALGRETVFTKSASAPQIISEPSLRIGRNNFLGVGGSSGEGHVEALHIRGLGRK